MSHMWHLYQPVGYTVYCHICGWGYDEQDPRVNFRYVDHVWECADEAECFTRRAGTEYLNLGGRIL